MQLEFSSLPADAKVWVYQADQKFSAQQKAIIEARLRLFMQEWAAHGVPLKCSFDLRYNQFIILAVDGTHYPPSGCSIDSAVRTMKNLSDEVGIDFFNRTKVAFMRNDDVSLISMDSLRDYFNQGRIDGNTLFFNNVIATKRALDNEWIIPAASSWLKRYMPSEKVNV